MHAAHSCLLEHSSCTDTATHPNLTAMWAQVSTGSVKLGPTAVTVYPLHSHRHEMDACMQHLMTTAT